MDLTHNFTVPVGIEEAWAHFNDIASVAQCFPGAQVAGVEDGTFTGSVKVKLGPIALLYNGSGTFVEKDEAAHRFVVDAKGKDKRGNGTAGAKVTVSMAAQGDDSTDVEVLTDLAITGKPAQFGRGVMQDVSDKLLGQFVACLEQRLQGATEEPHAEPAPAEPAAAAPLASASEPTAPSASAPTGGAHAASPPPAAPKPAPRLAPPPPQPAPRLAPPPPQDDAVDLGAAVLPVLAKTYWKQALGAVVVLLLLRRLLKRR